ncbi:MAG: hypothetical protein WD397_08515 [Wenzhouxiangellaceae bacterium]
MKDFLGRCHCGKIEVSFTTECNPIDIKPRVCDCTFCVKHAAAYVSDPDGRLVVKALSGGFPGRYRQGTETAEFLFCRYCGALVGVVADVDGQLVAAVNARCLDDWDSFAEGVTVSPQLLDKVEKMDRWKAVWVKDVRIMESGT